MNAPFDTLSLTAYRKKLVLKVLTILARHGIAKYGDAEYQVKRLFDEQFPDVASDLLIVDNSLASERTPERDGARTLISGDNSSWEFSAWDKGIEFLGEEIWSYSLVNLVTSAFNTLYTKYLARFDGRLLNAIVDRSVCVGHIDFYNEPVRIYSFRSQHWVRTSFLFIPPVELKLLGSLVSLTSRETLFGGHANEPFLRDAAISDNYRKYILDWLTGENIGQGTSWHTKIELNEQSWPFFRAKASAILNEQLLGLRLRAQGTNILDATWLATQLAKNSASGIDWCTSWKEQLAGRDVDRAIIV